MWLITDFIKAWQSFNVWEISFVVYIVIITIIVLHYNKRFAKQEDKIDG